MKCLLLFLLLLTSCAQLTNSPRPGGPSPAQAPPTIPGSSYLVCYYGEQWEWGLNTDGSYFSLKGGFGTGAFGTPVTADTLVAICNKTKEIKKITANFTGAYEALNTFSSNSAIIDIKLAPVFMQQGNKSKQKNKRLASNYGHDSVPHPSQLTFASDISYVACYFQNGLRPQKLWYWALNPDGSYYTMSGTWNNSKAGMIFTSSADPDTIIKACIAGDQSGWDFAVAYAAVHTLGLNYDKVDPKLVP